MKAVILAGGLGTRLKPFTEVIPKPLLPIGEQSVLEIQINRLKQHGFVDIFLATHYKSDYIRNFFGDGSRYGVRLTISQETDYDPREVEALAGVSYRPADIGAATAWQ